MACETDPLAAILYTAGVIDESGTCKTFPVGYRHLNPVLTLVPQALLGTEHSSK